MKYKIESCTNQFYCLEWKVYYKRGFFSQWVQFGKRLDLDFGQAFLNFRGGGKLAADVLERAPGEDGGELRAVGSGAAGDEAGEVAR